MILLIFILIIAPAAENWGLQAHAPEQHNDSVKPDKSTTLSRDLNNNTECYLFNNPHNPAFYGP